LSTEQKHRILRVISQAPQPIRYFTDGHFGIAARHVGMYVEQLRAAGLLTHNGQDDRLEITEAGLAEINRPTTIAHQREHCNASMPNWRPAPWLSVRAGADDHKRFKSLA
jgi:hypothetical protein